MAHTYLPAYLPTYIHTYMHAGVEYARVVSKIVHFFGEGRFARCRNCPISRPRTRPGGPETTAVSKTEIPAFRLAARPRHGIPRTPHVRRKIERSLSYPIRWLSAAFEMCYEAWQSQFRLFRQNLPWRAQLRHHFYLILTLGGVTRRRAMMRRPQMVVWVVGPLSLESERCVRHGSRCGVFQRCRRRRARSSRLFCRCCADRAFNLASSSLSPSSSSSTFSFSCSCRCSCSSSSSSSPLEARADLRLFAAVSRAAGFFAVRAALRTAGFSDVDSTGAFISA